VNLNLYTFKIKGVNEEQEEKPNSISIKGNEIRKGIGLIRENRRFTLIAEMAELGPIPIPSL